MMIVRKLRTDSYANGNCMVEIDVVCRSADDLEDLIAWLEMAKTFALGWMLDVDGKPDKKHQTGDL